MVGTAFETVQSVLAEVAYECSRRLIERNLADQPAGDSEDLWLTLTALSEMRVSAAAPARAPELAGAAAVAGASCLPEQPRPTPATVNLLTRRADLVRAAALLILELERLGRSPSRDRAN
jgi:hypothetical protein